MKTSISCLLLLSSVSLAQEVGLPDPLKYQLIPFDVGNSEARAKAQEAFFIQTGVSQDVDKIKAYLSLKVKDTSDKVSQAIDTNTPLNSKHVFFVAGTSYALVVKKSVSRSFRNPLVKDITNTISWSKDRCQLSFQLPF